MEDFFVCVCGDNLVSLTCRSHMIIRRSRNRGFCAGLHTQKT